MAELVVKRELQITSRGLCEPSLRLCSGGCKLT